MMVKIKAKRVHKTDGLEYLVQWGGRDKHKRPYKDSWEPASGLSRSQWAIDEFEDRRPLAKKQKISHPSLSVNSSMSFEASRNARYAELVAANPTATAAQLWRFNDQALKEVTASSEVAGSVRVTRSKK